MKHVLSIDLESWVHFYRDIFGENYCLESSDRKTADNGYLISAVKDIIKVLEPSGVKATFFVLGEIFDWYPDLIFDIQLADHEIAYHTHEHVILKSASVLEEQLKKSKAFVDTFQPKGFRAPQIYLPAKSTRILKKWNFEYSSSTYGPYSMKASIEGLEEIPVSSLQFFGRPSGQISTPRHLTLLRLFREVPFGSGLFFSLLQSKISYFLRKSEENNEPAILFVHPWQIHQPKEIGSVFFKLKVAFKNLLALPYTIGIKNCLKAVLGRHQFTSFEELRNGY